MIKNDTSLLKSYKIINESEITRELLHRMFDQLEPKEKEVIADIRSPSDIHSLEFVDEWVDDHLACVGVLLNGVPISFWWVDRFDREGIHYSNTSKKIQKGDKKLVFKLLSDQLDTHNQLEVVEKIRKSLDAQRQHIKTHDTDIANFESNLNETEELTHSQKVELYTKYNTIHWNKFIEWYAKEYGYENGTHMLEDLTEKELDELSNEMSGGYIDRNVDYYKVARERVDDFLFDEFVNYIIKIILPQEQHLGTHQVEISNF